MTPILRPAAERDLVERTRHYRLAGGDELGARFFDTASAALDSIGRMPGAGSPRVGEMCEVAGLRSRRVAGFPCHWFYFSHADHIDVVRLLDEAQNLPSILGEVDPDG